MVSPAKTARCVSSRRLFSSPRRINLIGPEHAIGQEDLPRDSKMVPIGPGEPQRSALAVDPHASPPESTRRSHLLEQ